MKNVLMVIPFFPPMAGGGVYRPLAFVKFMEQFGWRPTVVAPEGEAFWIRDDRLLAEIPPGCDVHRTATLSGQSILSRLPWRRGRGESRQVRSSRGFGAMRRLASFCLLPDTYIGWRPFAVREAMRVLRGASFDAIYSTSPPETSHLIAGKLHRMTRLPWISDFRDPWMNLYLLRPPTALHRRIHERMERQVCRRSLTVTTTRWHAETLSRKYPDLTAPVVIPNGYDHLKVSGVEGITPPSQPFRITHAGMLTQRRSAAPFLQGLKRFLDAAPAARGRCEVVFVGARESQNDAEVERLGLGDVVKFRGSIPNAESLATQRASHVLLLIKHLDTAYAGLVPGKLYEYIGLRRPILALAPKGEASDIVRRLNRGVVVAQHDPVQIAEAIAGLYERYERGELDGDYDLAPVPELRRERSTELLCDLMSRASDGKL